MRRYGKLVDSIWIRQRMDAKDARFARDMARRAALAPFTATSRPPTRYLVGDRVEVTNDAQVGEREIVLARNVVVEAISGDYPDQRYLVDGSWQSAATLRLILRA